MCLSKIEKKYPRGRSGFGYKVFSRTNDRKDIASEIFEENLYKVGRWYKARQIKIQINAISAKSFYYLSGFHIFLKKSDAEWWLDMRWAIDKVIRKVQYKNGHTLGTQKNRPIIVAEKMKIIRRRDE